MEFTMEPSDDFHLAPAREHDGKALKSAALCPSCQQVLPLTAFKRYLTGGELAAHGYTAGAKVEIETAKCRSCRPKRKPVQKLNTAELKNRAANGDLKPYLMQQILKERKKRALAAQRAGAIKSYLSKVKAKWGPILAGFKAEALAVRHQIKYERARAPAGPFMAFLTEYLTVLQETASLLKFYHIRLKPAMPEKGRDDWPQHVPNTQRKKLLDLWHDVPLEKRVKVRMPTLLTYRIPVKDGEEAAEQARVLPAPNLKRPVDTFEDL
jgi:hypothetical protein